MPGSTIMPPLNAERTPDQRPALRDYLLRPSFAIGFAFMSFTVVRFTLVAFYLPLYLLLAAYRSVLPYMIANLHLLLHPSGRSKLVERGKAWRQWRSQKGAAQLDGTWNFEKQSLEDAESHKATLNRLRRIWPVNREFFDVCGAQACVVHEVPVGTPKRRVVLVHGNPSWSYMYRNVVPVLVEQGYEVFALDLVGFGASQKPLVVEQVGFETHMRAIIQLYQNYDLKDTYILAHDWGGCIAMCTIPLLPPGACSGLFLLNSFFPSRPSDISLNCYLLYLLWLSAQGILGGLLPEGMIMRFMAPMTTALVADGYEAPFPSAPSKAAVTKLARLVPGMPDVMYNAFRSDIGALLDGACPRTSWSSLYDQSRLRERDKDIRTWWSSGQPDIRTSVLFGANDPLLIDYYDVLTNNIKTRHGTPERQLLRGAGHYPAEERPGEVARLFMEFESTGKGGA